MPSLASPRGVALIVVLLAISLLSAIGAGLTLSSSVSRMTVANYDEAVALLYAADAALELAAHELAAVPFDAVLAGTRVSRYTDGPAGTRTIAGTDAIDLPRLTEQLTCGSSSGCSDAQLRQTTSERPWGANNPRWRLFVHQPLAPGVPLPAPVTPVYIVVWIGDDARETDDDPLHDGAGPGQEGRYMVRARAESFGPRGARYAIEAELARFCTEGGAGEVCVPGTRVQSWRAVSNVLP